MSGDEIQAALAEHMPPHQTWCQTIGHFDCCGKTDVDCDCGISESLDDLLPVVRDIAAREAARALRDAADHYDDLYHDETVATELRTRARALGLDPTHGKATT